MSRVLVIEDEADLREVLEYNLTKEGHRVHLASTAAEGLALAREIRPEVVLLDVMLPDQSGTSVCKALRGDPKTQDARIIMLTAKGEEIDRVVGFEVGADDYVVKPFSVRELLLRIAAMVRRSLPAPTPIIAFGELRIDRAAHRVWVEEVELYLTTLEFKLLVTLYERRNRVQSRSALLNDIWGIEADITTRTVDTHVKRLREKIGVAGRYIETVRGVGYRFSETPNEGSA